MRCRHDSGTVSSKMSTIPIIAASSCSGLLTNNRTAGRREVRPTDSTRHDVAVMTRGSKRTNRQSRNLSSYHNDDADKSEQIRLLLVSRFSATQSANPVATYRTNSALSRGVRSDAMDRTGTGRGITLLADASPPRENNSQLTSF